MREIIFDTETTGLYPREGDRITELGCVEVIDLIATGRDFQELVDPERDIPKEVTAITGHTREMLRGKPKFVEVADRFLDFVGDAVLVAHNASFDMGFINMELERAGRTPFPASRFKDTAEMARARFPGASASLDALCKRFEISLQSRSKHGALIDAYLLAEVYLELNGGREQRLDFLQANQKTGRVEFPARPRRPRALEPRLTEADRARHAEFIDSLPGPALWKTFR